MPFFISLEKKIIKAKFNGKSSYIQMDANSKLGPEIIAGNLNQQSENGKILYNIINRNVLTVMNGMKSKYKGLITRKRITSKVKELSVIDFVIVSKDMEDMISQVVALRPRSQIKIQS